MRNYAQQTAKKVPPNYKPAKMLPDDFLHKGLDELRSEQEKLLRHKLVELFSNLVNLDKLLNVKVVGEGGGKLVGEEDVGLATLAEKTTAARALLLKDRLANAQQKLGKRKE